MDTAEHIVESSPRLRLVTEQRAWPIEAVYYLLGPIGTQHAERIRRLVAELINPNYPEAALTQVWIGSMIDAGPNLQLGIGQPISDWAFSDWILASFTVDGRECPLIGYKLPCFSIPCYFFGPDKQRQIGDFIKSFH